MIFSENCLSVEIFLSGNGRLSSFDPNLTTKIRRRHVHIISSHWGGGEGWTQKYFTLLKWVSWQTGLMWTGFLFGILCFISSCAVDSADEGAPASVCDFHPRCTTLPSLSFTTHQPSTCLANEFSLALYRYFLLSKFLHLVFHVILVCSRLSHSLLYVGLPGMEPINFFKRILQTAWTVARESVGRCA
jgi:hypothetical protein